MEFNVKFFKNVYVIVAEMWIYTNLQKEKLTI